MSSKASKNSNTSSKAEKLKVSDNRNSCDDYEVDGPENQDSAAVTRHLMIKHANNTTATLDRDTVLRRIRHRKRVNKVRNALEGFFGSGKNDKALAREKSWIDDVFFAP